MPKGSAVPVRKQLQQVYKQTKKLPKELRELPPFPKALNHLWQWFKELSLTRGNNGFSLNRLTYTEIMSWATLKRIQLKPWEVEVIIALDNLFIEQSSKE